MFTFSSLMKTFTGRFRSRETDTQGGFSRHFSSKMCSVIIPRIILQMSRILNCPNSPPSPILEWKVIVGVQRRDEGKENR